MLEKPRVSCYANVMSIRRITISVPDRVARRIKKIAADMSVSAWATGLIEERLGDAELDRLWQDFYRGVRPRREEVRRANAMFRRLTKPSRRTSERGWPVLSADADDLPAIDPTLSVQSI